jgi:C-terminal processing protease CtpA/Prc
MPVAGVKSWERLLKPYVKKVLSSRSDSAYYMILRDMLKNLPHGRIILNDSEIFNFTGDFVVPFQFARIDGDLVVTRVEDSTLLPVLRPGTRIFRIEGMSVQEILSAGSTVFLSDSIRGMNDLVFNRSNFRGRAGSEISLDVADGQGTRNLQVARTRRASGYGTWHPDTSGLRDAVAYLHPHDRWKLNDMEVFSEKDGLILDLRNTSLTSGYTPLYNTSVSTPVVSAARPRTGDRRLSRYSAREVPPFLRDMPMAVLIDHTTRGRAEQLARELSRLERVFLVGGLTSGMPPRRAVINLPGGARILFPGQVSHSSIDKESSTKGYNGFPPVYPDIPVERTMKSVREVRDEMFDKAREMLRQRLHPDKP